jgi:hypothetical protein
MVSEKQSTSEKGAVLAKLKKFVGFGGHNTEYRGRGADDAEGIATRFVGTQPKQD